MNRKSPTFSLRFLLILMAIFCALLGSLFYLARIPLVTEELSMLLGRAPPPRGPANRGSWLVFLMFTYIAPLLLAATMYVFTGFWRWYSKRFEESNEDDRPSPLD